jgi:dolichol-phosphate mannosyltransferase/undecaprenyl-phosphate 4-deoxy-4-formamido-L-arabinose transferase
VYSIVIAVYNSTQSLLELTERLVQVFNDQIKDTFEIIFVDDASPDPGTWDTLKALHAKYPNIVLIQLMKNFGQSGAVLCGLRYARGKYIITMDDDLEHLPEEIPTLIKHRDHDIVIGAFHSKTHSFFRRLASKIKGYFDYKIIGKPRHIKNSPFKLIRKEVVDAVNRMNISNPFISALLFYASNDIVNVSMKHGKRKYGQSGYTLNKLFQQFFNLLFNNSIYLLKIIGNLGTLFAALSIALSLFYLYKKIFIGIPVPGWTTVVILLLLFGGIFLFSLRVIGEYLIRIINVIEVRPAFIIRKTTPSLGDDE